MVEAKVLTGRARPSRVLELSRPPERLYLHGELPEGPKVAIVGTRHCTGASADFALNLACSLARQGFVVLSGGAVGIDAAAHRGALEAGGRTVVVAPAGYQRPFPPEHRDLFARVVQAGGGYLSLVPDNESATRGGFFPRNGCLVALCHALVVVEAGYRSGARNAAAQARALGRPVWVVPHPPWNGQGAGCIEELRRGAWPLRDARDIVRHLRSTGVVALSPAGHDGEQPSPSVLQPAGVPTQRSASEPMPEPVSVPAQLSFSGPAGAVLQAVARGAKRLDDLCDQTGLSAAEVQRLLLTLRLEGVLVSDGAGGFAPATP